MDVLPTAHYTTLEASRLLSIHPKYIYQMHRQGKIRFALDCTGRYRVPMWEVGRILAERGEI